MRQCMDKSIKILKQKYVIYFNQMKMKQMMRVTKL